VVALTYKLLPQSVLSGGFDEFQEQFDSFSAYPEELRFRSCQVTRLKCQRRLLLDEASYFFHYDQGIDFRLFPFARHL